MNLRSAPTVSLTCLGGSNLKTAKPSSQTTVNRSTMSSEQALLSPKWTTSCSKFLKNGWLERSRSKSTAQRMTPPKSLGNMRWVGFSVTKAILTLQSPFTWNVSTKENESWETTTQTHCYPSEPSPCCTIRRANTK